MSRIELTIHESYVPGWGHDQCVRECLQNALDRADDGEGHEMEVEHSGRTLRITSKGTALPIDVWLLGYTNKAGDNAKRGEFGEGLDLGILAMVREGRKVSIWNGGERWAPKLEPSRSFSGKVLTVYTRKLKHIRGDFTIELEITADEWSALRRKYLALCPAKTVDGGIYGDLIIDPERKGWLYCKGIWFDTQDDFEYGYNFNTVELDRDRKMANAWSMRYHMGYIWMALIKRDMQWARVAYQLLKEGHHKDCDNLADSMAASMVKDSNTVAESMAEVFRTIHGKNTLPVCEQGKAATLAHYGHISVVVPRVLSDVLANVFGSFSEILEKVSELHCEVVPWDSLSEIEQIKAVRAFAIFYEAVSWAGSPQEITSNIEIAAFTRDDILGTFDPANGMIYISRRTLTSMMDFLGVLLHEKVHEHTKSNDGSVLQTHMESNTWKQISLWLYENTTNRFDSLVLDMIKRSIYSARNHEQATTGN